MHRLMLIIIVLVLLAGCGSSTSTMTAQQVLDKFAAAGLDAKDAKPDPPNPDSPLPKSFKEQLGFTVSEVAPRGGQIFVCDTKKNCDAIYAYFDALKGLAGPYLYQSPNGTVVAQLNSGLKPDTASKYESVIKELP